MTLQALSPALLFLALREYEQQGRGKISEYRI